MEGWREGREEGERVEEKRAERVGLSEGVWVRDKEGKLERERTNRQRTQQALSLCHILLRNEGR